MESQKLLTIATICATLAAIIFFIQMILFILHLKRTKISTLPTACAGSPQPGTPTNIKIQDLPIHNFHTETGEQINFDDYEKFWIKGWSMLLCGIRNNDILFAKRISEADLFFDTPKVLVLKREGKSLAEAITKDDDAKYKVRRTWAMLLFNEAQIIAEVKKIMENKFFRDLKNDYPENFFSDEDMITDLKSRIAKYKREYPNCEKASNKDNRVIISTTLRKIGKERKVFFSIHPARIIVAEAVHSFHKEEDYPQIS